MNLMVWLLSPRPAKPQFNVTRLDDVVPSYIACIFFLGNTIRKDPYIVKRLFVYRGPYGSRLHVAGPELRSHA